MQQGHYLWELCRKLLWVFVLFSCYRLLFFIFNYGIFADSAPLDIIMAFVAGIRFDLSAIAYINGLLILSFLLPFPQKKHPLYQKVQFFIYLIINGLALFFETIDLAYFPYAFRRTISSDLDIIRTNSQLTSSLAIQYWWLIVIWAIAIGLLWQRWISKKTRTPDTLTLKGQAPYLILGIIFFGLMARGGWQLRPLSPIYASSYVKNKNLVPLIYNTSLSLLFSLQQKQLEDPKFFSTKELDEIFPVIKLPSGEPMKKDNVVIIVLESFGKEHVGFYQNDSISYTPFLDSLLKTGKQCQWSFANGMRSTKGIVAITAGIPSLMEDPLMFSAYQSNQVEGLAALLGKKGYQSSFYHGANTGSMQFEKFCEHSGFDEYLDREDYGTEQDYDGQWGVWDIPYFKYVAKKIGQKKEPFFSVLFSLTSHHPYKTETWFEKTYPNEPPKLRSIRYTDLALKYFFQEAQTQDWFKNTLFVITADHIGIIDKPYYYSRTGRLEVPILFYHPSENWRDTVHTVSQQIDILPSVLDYLNYDSAYKAFGQSIFKPNRKGKAYALLEEYFHYVDDEFVLNFDGQKSNGIFDYKNDPRQKIHLRKQFPEREEQMERHLKAVIQRHHRGMLFNEWR